MAPGIARSQGSLPPYLTAGRRVLVIEEDKMDRGYICTTLKGHGFEVISCMDVEEGAHCLVKGAYDFVVVSQGSRAFEGRAVLERVLSIDRHIPVVVLTRVVDMHCYLEAMQMGAVDYLEKPLSEAELIRVVETHLRPHSAVA